MAEVYVVTRGEYSDYHICAVTLDKQRAKKLAKMYSSSYDTAFVETWETDTAADDNAINGRHQYIVHLYKSGNTDCFKNNYDYHLFSEKAEEHANGDFSVWLYAADEMAAIKIAAEKRAMYLAEKEGIV